jgi:hypothetical protein
VLAILWINTLVRTIMFIHEIYIKSDHRNSFTGENNIHSKYFFIITTDAHNYKIIGMLKTIKIPTIAPTCFGSHRNHHQGAISCLAKTTIMILLCSSLMTWSMLWRHTSLLCKRVIARLHNRLVCRAIPYRICGVQSASRADSCPNTIDFHLSVPFHITDPLQYCQMTALLDENTTFALCHV